MCPKMLELWPHSLTLQFSFHTVDVNYSEPTRDCYIEGVVLFFFLKNSFAEKNSMASKGISGHGYLLD